MVRVLGPIDLTHADGTVVPVGSARLRRALAALTISSGAVVSVDRLADLLWGDAQPANPEASLHTVISRLRALLTSAGLAGHLQTRAPGYLLLLGHGECDATVFTDLAETATRMVDTDPAHSAAVLDTALALWRGPAYAEFADEDFAAAEIARIVECRAAAAECRTHAALLLGRWSAAIRLAEQEIADAPFRERPRAQLMLALYRSGRQPDALAVFRDFRRLLDDDLGLTPSDDLIDLENRILRQDPALSGPGPAEQQARPEARTAAGNVPTVLPSLLGRDVAVDELTALLREHRLVTLVGPGGVGKTRLALAAAAREVDAGPFIDGVWFIELAPLRTESSIAESSIAEAVSTVLSVSPQAGRSTADRLLEFLATQRALLILDNSEHLVHGVARWVQTVLERCPQVTVLPTSQTPLRLRTERVFAVGPLATDGGFGIPAAVRLFIDRASTLAPGFAPSDSSLVTIAELCRRLDGMPLAIELAAGRMQSMTPREVLDRLADRFRLLRAPDRLAEERHSTLRSVVDWSYGLLGPEEQRLFDRLSVFRGGFGLTEAAAVVGRSDLDVVGPLDALVEHSMVQATAQQGADSTTFTLLETLRAFGAERLVAGGEEPAARGAHARTLLQLVRQGTVAVPSPDCGPWVRAVAARFDDLRAAHAWALDNDLPLALQLVAGLADWLEFQVSTELVGWAEQAARRSVDAGLTDPEVRRSTIVALTMASAGGRIGGDLDRALLLSAQSAELADDDADPVLRYPLFVRSEIALYQGRLEECAALALRVQPLAERAGDVLRAKWSVMNRLLALAYGGQVDDATAIARTLADEPGLTGIARAWARYSLGEVLMTGDPDRALETLERAVDDGRRLSDRFLTGVALLSAASLRARHGDPALAVPMFREVLEHWHRMGNWTQRWTTFRAIADLLARLGDARAAALLVGAARAESRPSRVFGPDTQRLDDLEDRLRTGLGDGLAELLHTGAAMADDEVFRLARAALAAQDPVN